MFQTKLAPKNISNISNFYTHTYKLNGLIIETSFVLITLTVCYLHIQMNPARVSRLLLTTLPTALMRWWWRVLVHNNCRYPNPAQIEV